VDVAKRRLKTVHQSDRISAEELLELVAYRKAARAKGVLPDHLKKRVRQGLTGEQKALYHEQLFADAMMAQDYAISLMFASDNPQVQRVALNAAIDVKDRIMGKPTERLQVNQPVRVVIHGLDLSRFPDPPAVTATDRAK
jgi:hypothetical protein